VIGPEHQVTFRTDTGIRVQCLLDTQMANLTGGFGGWEVVQRPKRVSITRWNGKDPFTMDLPVRFDGTLAPQKGQEIAISMLLRMSQPSGPLKQPPIITLDGPVPRTDLKWVIQNLEFDNQNVMWENYRGIYVRIRQSVVVQLLQFVDDQVISTPPAPATLAGGASAGSKVIVSTGKTAKQEAQAAYGSAQFWKDILDANPFLLPDPRAPITAGQSLVIPPQGQKSKSNTTQKSTRNAFNG
jgi:hypothetical protein